MNLASLNAICPGCRSHFNGVPRRSFFGFQKLPCPHCDETVVYPLTGGYRTFYGVLLCFMVLGLVGSWAQGVAAMPNALAIAAIYALVRNERIRQRVARLEATSPDERVAVRSVVQSQGGES
ncbi:hypothetical protein HLB44_18655 [Aquincola sp. S2]|uniref:DUF983 domain-containing protein n=1 Tax=Pseudaquabacterium terrae TaxID=2732868 RepID=A0ABX2EK71_9BURK|nr:hypothetical protein [Aquabacterium terrae]NRF69018.1 hypothetical protein [Aquabacterium terrae]